jgi:hypothetical protein
MVRVGTEVLTSCGLQCLVPGKRHLNTVPALHHLKGLGPPENVEERRNIRYSIYRTFELSTSSLDYHCCVSSNRECVDL